jgi:hypothetical protein
MRTKARKRKRAKQEARQADKIESDKGVVQLIRVRSKEGSDSPAEDLWADHLELVPLLPPRPPTCVLEPYAVAYRVLLFGYGGARRPPPSICERDNRPSRMLC